MLQYNRVFANVIEVFRKEKQRPDVSVIVVRQPLQIAKGLAKGLVRAVPSQGDTDESETLMYDKKAERDEIDFYKAMEKIVQMQPIIDQSLN